MGAGCWRLLPVLLVISQCHAGGRLFATLLGYPHTCTRGHTSHACTLALACWLAGGSSEAGCGSNPWFVACCVDKSPPPVPVQIIKHQDPLEKLDHGGLGGKLGMGYIEGNAIAYEGIGPKMDRMPVLQRRVDADASSNEIPTDCGLSADRILYKRIIGGTEARFAQFPWQAHIRISAYQCGGVLVSRSFVATAAHCIVRARLPDITVHLGELDTQDTGQVLELAPAERHRVRRRLVHPLFRFRITQPDRYDIALLQLATSAGRMFHISPVCLPLPGMKLNGRSGVVAGWGKIRPSTDLTGTNVLRSAVVPILDSNECIAWHESRHISVELEEEMVCAGHADGSSDACLGDSGGPLIVLERGRWTLAGITSAGFGCGEPRQPGIYHNVALTAQWIRSVIQR